MGSRSTHFRLKALPAPRVRASLEDKAGSEASNGLRGSAEDHHSRLTSTFRGCSIVHAGHASRTCGRIVRSKAPTPSSPVGWKRSTILGEKLATHP